MEGARLGFHSARGGGRAAGVSAEQRWRVSPGGAEEELVTDVMEG